jgi:YhcH/YjgK/YiaL family protein
MKKIVLLIILIATVKIAGAQTTDSVKTANKWVKSKVWAKDLKIKADPSINNIEFKKQYEGNKELWDKVFKFLGDPKLATLAPGKYVIDGDNAYATVAEGAPKNIADVKWESHRKYIDLQYVIAGKVKIGVAPISAATVTMPYDKTKDIANYTAEGKFYIATPEIFFLFFPQNAHRPDIKVDGYDTLKKLVIKIRYKE